MNARTITDPTNLHDDDRDLLRRLELCEEDALFLLYSRYQRLVYSLAFRILRSEEEAQELLQEVFLHVWSKAPRFDPNRGNLDTWLLSVTHHRAIDRLRTRRDKEKASPDRVDPEVLAGRSVEKTIQQDGPSLRLAAEEREALVTALRDLSVEQKQALELVYYEGHSLTEIGEMLSLPADVVKKRVRQAMITMRAHLHRGGQQIGTASAGA